MKVLIVTYTYPPSKSVNGNRPFYFAQTLIKSGHEVHVLSRHFNGEETNDQYNDDNLTPYQLTVENGIIVHRVPFSNSWFKYYKNRVFLKTGLWRAIYLIQLAFGRICQESYNKYFTTSIGKVLKSIQPEKVIVESGPTNLVRLVSEKCTQLNISYIIDFRDVYYHEMLYKGVLPLSKKIKIYFEKKHMKTSIQRSEQIIGESIEKLKALSIGDKPFTVIHNGYEEEIWNKYISYTENQEEFILCCPGTLYNFSFLDQMLDCLSQFARLNLNGTKFLFINPGNDLIHQKIKRALGGFDLNIKSNRCSKEEAIDWINKSSVLFYHGWNGYTGVYSTKIYDYIRSGKKILIYPSDHDVIEKTISNDSQSFISDDINCCVEQLGNWHKQWSQREKLMNPNAERYTHYSRQVECEKIVKLISNN